MHAPTPDHARRTSATLTKPRWVAASVTALLFVITAAMGVVPGAPVASAAPGDPVGCGYGTGGPFADTLCWIDMTGYDDATARSADGQAMSVTLPGGYTVDFTVRTSGTRGIVASAFPTWTFGDRQGAPVGNLIYLGTPGMPALYQVIGQGAADTTITLDAIEVTDSSGNAVRGWRFVGVDAEATADVESITFTSDAAVSTLATFSPPDANNGCQLNVQQIDANTIRCSGGAAGDRYGTVLVGATEPSSFTQTMTVNNFIAREGVAFAFQSSTLSLDAAVTGRVAASDSFDVSVTSPEGQVVGSADTGTTDAASTGDLVVLPRVDGSSYTLRIAGGTSTNLAGYSFAWACTRNGVDDPTLAATGVTSIQVSPAAGEDIGCIVTGTVAPPASTTTTTSTTLATTSTTSVRTTAASPVAASPRFTG